jgi:hypothetical protein
LDLNGNPLIEARGVSGRLGLGYGKYGLFGLQSPLYIVQWLNNLPLGFSLCMAGSAPFIDMGEILATSGIYEWTPGASPFFYGCAYIYIPYAILLLFGPISKPLRDDRSVIDYIFYSMICGSRNYWPLH